MDLTTLKIVQKNFFKELKDANAGKKTSLPFIIHELPNTSLVKEDEVFEALVIGGSVCTKALLKKTQKKLKIIKKESINSTFLKKYQDPADFIERNLYPDIRIVALNFAYPLKPVFEQGRLDGILMSGSKEHTFKKILHKKVGKEIEDYVAKKQNRQIIVSVANDTICLLLSGLTKYSWEELVGGVLGTGVNFAFFLDKNHLVNLESANFDKFLQSIEAKELDKKSTHPGKSLFEKEVSGAYLCELFNIALKVKGIKHERIHDTKELDDLMLSDDRKLASLAKSLMEKSADLVAGEIGGIALFKKRNLIFVMEGSLFWVALGYKRRISARLLETVPFGIKFSKIEDSNIFGAAKLVA